MPPLDEGSLLVMPMTFAGISIEEARRAMQRQHRTIMRFPEVVSVHGKAGRAETATDPAQLDMIESVITLRPATMADAAHASVVQRLCAWLAQAALGGRVARRAARARWPSCRATLTARSARPAIRWPSRRPSGHASTC